MTERLRGRSRSELPLLFSVSALRGPENRATIATSTAPCRKRKCCFIMPRLSGGLHETVVVRCCSHLSCACRGAAVPGAKRLHTGSGYVRTCSALPASRSAVSCAGRRSHGLVGRFHHPSQIAGWLQNRTSYSSQQGKRNRDLRYAQVWDG